MKHFKFVYTLAVVSIFTVSCSTISYSPKLTLDVSPKTIQKSVQVEKFIDSSPLEDKQNPFLGLSVTNQESLSGELNLEVTNAIISDFSVNAVFSSISRKLEKPDYLMKGEIIKFNGKSTLNNYAKASYVMALAAFIIAPIAAEPLVYLGTIPLFTWYLGIPISNNTSEISIVIKLYDKNNLLVGTYQNDISSRKSSNMYNNRSLAVPSMTNKLFSEAIQNIRMQIIQDIDKLNAQ